MKLSVGLWVVYGTLFGIGDLILGRSSRVRRLGDGFAGRYFPGPDLPVQQTESERHRIMSHSSGLIDPLVHLDDKRYTNVPEILARAADTGVEHVVWAGTEPAEDATKTIETSGNTTARLARVGASSCLRA